ncbi:MAG: polysaccharide deacetylase family protein [Solirubrobacterales bacterium]
MSDPAGGRRRGRRAAEQRRRGARRRRNFLGCAAAGAFLVGLVAGAGGSAEQDAPSEPGEATHAPGDAPTVTGFDGAVPILMYHAIAPAPVGEPYPDLFVPQAAFEEQMAWLAEEGYHAVTLGEAFAAWEDGAPIARRPIVISFDDGLRSQYVGAAPTLERLGWPAVLNLKVEAVDQGELSEEMVKELVGAGWEIDAHSYTHPDLTSLDAGALRREVGGSRRELQRRFGEPVDFFCYPAGSFDDEVIAAVRDAGYRGATTTKPGLALLAKPYELNRIRVEPGDGPDELAAKLEGV